MNCKTFIEVLTEQPDSVPAAEHLRSCAGCRALVGTLQQPAALGSALPDERKLAQIQQLMTSSLEPVRTLPSDVAMTAGWMVLFTILSLLGAALVGFQGFARLFPLQRGAVYGVILVAALALSACLVQEMIPGSKHRLPVWQTIIISLLALSLTALVYPSFELKYFVPRGVPCLRFGMFCALLSSPFIYLILRRGWFVSPARTCLIAGSFAGLIGLAALALHCPQQNALHALVWHVGAMVLAGFAGAFAGLVSERLYAE